jgi:hypothetical protein
MKKGAKRKSIVKKARKSVTTKQPSTSVVKGKVAGGMVDKQPEVKETAAVAHAMFLYTDDAWALRYFDQNDLHFLEREVFG